MNWDIIEGNWDKVKWKMKETWWDITDDEIMEMKWSAQQMSWKIQEKYWITKEEADKKIEKLSDSL